MELTGDQAFSTAEVIGQAAQYLAAADPRLAPLVEEFGPPDRLLAKNTPCFRSLAKSILYQQLAGTAAAAIYSRFLAVCGVPDESQLTPTAVLDADPAALRGCGLSERKASYLQDLAAHFQDGRLSDELLTSLPDAALLSTLTAVRGIGPWTVDMFAMFHLGRPDVLPVGDLGVRKGLAQVFGLDQLPSPAQMEQLTAPWRPYRSLGCYYMWRIPLPAAKRPAAAAKASTKAAKAKKAKQAAIASPLGAAVAAVADVGVTPEAPMLAAVSVVSAAGTAAAAAGSTRARARVTTSVAGPSSAWGCKEEQQHATPPGLKLAPITPSKPAPSAAAPPAGNSHRTAGSTGAAGQAAALSNNHSMVTRRRLRWAARAANSCAC